jgi:hypothetical protein
MFTATFNPRDLGPGKRAQLARAHAASQRGMERLHMADRFAVDGRSEYSGGPLDFRKFGHDSR